VTLRYSRYHGISYETHHPYTHTEAQIKWGRVDVVGLGLAPTPMSPDRYEIYPRHGVAIAGRAIEVGLLSRTWMPG